MLHNQFSIRHIKFQDLLEDFMIAAIVAILGIRIYLELTGYPQIGNETLHISHMLWGGLLMSAALSLLLIFLNDSIKRLAAIIGGLGFGTFIDEIGKFITQDNNYFYQPSFAIMYIIFISIYIAMRAYSKHKNFSPKEYLINSLEIMKEAVIYDLDQEEKKRALEYLQRADQKDEITQAIYKLYKDIDAVHPSKPNIFLQLWDRLKTFYYNLVSKKWFPITINTFFIIKSILTSITTVSFFIRTFSSLEIPLIQLITQSRSISEIAASLSAHISGLFVIIGVISMRKERIKAYRWFKRSLLISIFLTYVFLFYTNQLEAFAGLVFNILLLATLNYMIVQEKLARHAGGGSARHLRI